MYVTGRYPLLVGAGVVPVILGSVGGIPAWAGAAAWLGFCLLLLGLDVLSAPNPRRVNITRAGPTKVLRDQPSQVTAAVVNTGTRTLRIRVRDAWQPTAGATTGTAVIRIDPGASGRVVTSLLPRRRGELRSAGLAVRSAGPLGLAGRSALIAVPGSIRVLPPFTSRRHLPSRLARLRELDGNTSVQVRGQGTEFDSLREYVRGDDVRSIDWRATARASATMLRTWRPERDRHIVIIIDTGRTAATRVDDGVRLDAAMEAALLLSALAAQAGDHIHLLMFDRAVRARVTGRDGAALLPALVDAMVAVDAGLIDTDWDAAFAQARLLTTRPSMVVVLTAHDDPEASRGFLGALPLIPSHTHVLVAAAQPEQTEASQSDAFEAAARERARWDADRMVTALSRAGVDALSASAEELPPRVADRYLALKALGRL
ncbi:MAG: DUF58 domain-containing protein [Actinobacteria bacterium]|jgi:uncharacterized protein (DUF58 family)|nr:MAG: DUF58 domain-containing protein [Actinomycetota bacterium]HIE60647.1 DUF58 domain-containing protein [Microbacterium sp.]